MNIKFGKIELEEWVKPCVNGIQYHTWHRFVPGIVFTGNSHQLDCVFINYDVTQKWFPEFRGSLECLARLYQPKVFESEVEAKDYIDNFIIRIGGLTLFL